MPSEKTDAPSPPRERRDRRRRRHVYWLLVLPFIGMLWVPFYNHDEPRLGAIPFFYWYQFMWIGISAALTAVVYFATASKNDTER